MPPKSQIAIVGPGRLGGALSLALTEAGYRVSEVISRNTPDSRKRAQEIARAIGSVATTPKTSKLDSHLIWLCVPDREISAVTRALSHSTRFTCTTPFQSRGPLHNARRVH